jgi:hypothetical protein
MALLLDLSNEVLIEIIPYLAQYGVLLAALPGPSERISVSRLTRHT